MSNVLRMVGWTVIGWASCYELRAQHAEYDVLRAMNYAFALWGCRLLAKYNKQRAKDWWPCRRVVQCVVRCVRKSFIYYIYTLYTYIYYYYYKYINTCQHTQHKKASKLQQNVKVLYISPKLRYSHARPHRDVIMSVPQQHNKGTSYYFFVLYNRSKKTIIKVSTSDHAVD